MYTNVHVKQVMSSKRYQSAICWTFGYSGVEREGVEVSEGIKVQVGELEGNGTRTPTNAIHEWKGKIVKSPPSWLRHQAQDSIPLCDPYWEAHCWTCLAQPANVAVEPGRPAPAHGPGKLLVLELWQP